MNLDRAQLLAAKIAHAYKLSRTKIPDETTIAEMGVQMAADTLEIPPMYIMRCFDFARIHYHDIPTSRLVIKAWDSNIKPESLKPAEPQKPVGTITHQPKPDEFWRDVSTARISLTMNPRSQMPISDAVRRMVALEPTRTEIESFIRMIKESTMPDILTEHWAGKAPYNLTTDQIRLGLPEHSSSTSPSYYREPAYQ